MSSMIATAADFCSTVIAVELFGVHYLLAACLGAVCGAFTNFLINRYWTFKATEKPARVQGFRYALVWTGSVLLNISGIFLMTEFLRVSYVLSKTIVAIIVGFTYNYFLQKEYVFNEDEKITYR